MSMKVGISKQAFLTMGTYFFIIVFHSASLLAAAAAAVCVLLVQTAAYLILPVLAGRTARAFITYSAVLFTVILSAIIYRVYGLLPIGSVSLEMLPFPDLSYILILVPLLADQAKAPEGYRPRFAAIQGALFVCLILVVSALREILGFGTIGGIRMIPEGSPPMPLLSHSSGAAFLLLLLILPALYGYRRITGKAQVLAVLDKSNTYTGQPVLDKEEEIDRVYYTIFSLLTVIPAALGLYFLTAFILPKNMPFDILLLVTVFLQGIVLLVLHLITGSKNPYITRIMELPWLIPVLTYILVLPCSLPLRILIYGNGALEGLAVLFLYLGFALLACASVLLFARSAKRRLLFGRRPDLLSGLPLLLLFAGLGLMVLTGFSAVTDVFFTH